MHQSGASTVLLHFICSNKFRKLLECSIGQSNSLGYVEYFGFSHKIYHMSRKQFCNYCTHFRVNLTNDNIWWKSHFILSRRNIVCYTILKQSITITSLWHQMPLFAKAGTQKFFHYSNGNGKHDKQIQTKAIRFVVSLVTKVKLAMWYRSCHGNLCTAICTIAHPSSVFHFSHSFIALKHSNLCEKGCVRNHLCLSKLSYGVCQWACKRQRNEWECVCLFVLCSLIC